MTIEQLAKQIFAECQKDGEPVSEAEALEMAQMELGAKSIVNYTKSEVKTSVKSSKPKKSTVSEEKKQLFQLIFSEIQSAFGENAQIAIENKLITVQIGEKRFKIDVIEQRATKK